ncbi:hypothetical protein MESS4_430118 [Mesorhizobium sp. STM 4661]|nr:hypothetical protein MESS4_430118 [Mesorhizobium sp. STM 4661]
MLRIDPYPVLARIAFLVTLPGVLLLALSPVRLLQELGLAFTFHHDKLNHATAFAVLAALGSLSWPERKARRYGCIRLGCRLCRNGMRAHNRRLDEAGRRYLDLV